MAGLHSKHFIGRDVKGREIFDVRSAKNCVSKISFVLAAIAAEGGGGCRDKNIMRKSVCKVVGSTKSEMLIFVRQ